MPTFTEPFRPYEVLISEAPGTLSRESVTVVSGQGALSPGQVMAKITASGKYVKYDNVGSDGSEVAAAILLQAVDATSADADVVAVVRLAEVKIDALVWDSGVDGAGQTAGLVDLATDYIKAR